MNNPELKKQIWLEISTYRVLVTPLVLLLIFVLAYLKTQMDVLEWVTPTAIVGYFLITCCGGARQVAESISYEVHNHVWDEIRMSPLSSWQLVIGKLFGATVFYWYGGSICLLILIAYSSLSFVQILVMLQLAIISHQISFLNILIALRKNRKFSRSQTAASLALSGLISLSFFITLFDNGKNKLSYTWYGLEMKMDYFILLTTSLAVFWMFAACNNIIRLELQMRNSILSWISFLVFLVIYILGFNSDKNLSFLIIQLSFVGLIYFTLFSGSNDYLSMMKIKRKVMSKNLKDISESIPRWGVSLLAYLLSIFICIFLLGVKGKLVWAALALFFFVVRDIALIHHLALIQKKSSSDLKAVLLFTVLYIIVPLLFKTAGWDSVLFIFLPNPEVQWSLVAPLIQALLVVWLYLREWSKMTNK